jgi:hypothetical protein
MPTSFPQRRALRYVRQVQITPLHLLILASISSAAAFWSWLLISGQSFGASEKYLLLLGLYGLASAAFVFSRVKDNHLRFFDIPVFLTILGFVEFGLAPLECFIVPGKLNYNFDGNYTALLKALLYVIVGTTAFWVGCILIERRTESRGAPRDHASRLQRIRANARTLQVTVGIYAAAFAVKVYLLTHHLYSYLSSGALYSHNLASMQVLNIAAGFGTYGLIIACIETHLDTSDQKWKLVFWAIFASENSWGLISGMKSLLIQNFVIVALVSSLIQRKFRKGWIAVALLGFVVLYPISNDYREAVIRGGAQGGQGASLSTAGKAGEDALRRTYGVDSRAWSEIEGGWSSAVSRFDLLQSVGLIVSMGPRAAELPGHERWWMLPFYPFIPRLIWPSKPVLNEGGRFSVALGYGTMNTVGTSTAVTYPGDLYARGGLLGICMGMFLLGIVAQWLTNTVTGVPETRHLFVYAAMFLTATDMEVDAFSFLSGLIKTFVILSVTAWLAYDTGRRPPTSSAPIRRAFVRPREL